jgi:hypothetical protein
VVSGCFRCSVVGILVAMVEVKSRPAVEVRGGSGAVRERAVGGGCESTSHVVKRHPFETLIRHAKSRGYFTFHLSSPGAAWKVLRQQDWRCCGFWLFIASTMSATLPFRDINVRASSTHYAFSSPSSPNAPTLVVDRPSGDLRLNDGKLTGGHRVSSISGILGIVKLRLGRCAP